MMNSALCLSTLLVVNVVLSQAAVLSTCPSTDDVKVQKKIIEKTNYYRKIVQPSARNMLEVSWSNEAAKNAAKWAKQCKFEHSKPEEREIENYSCGENLYMTSEPAPWDEAFKAFDNEKKDFRYGKGATSKAAVTGHYTQQIWYNSRLMGCACAHCPGGEYEYFYVCQYCPPGNFVDSLDKPYKEGSKCADCPKNCKDGLCTNPCTDKNIFSNCPDLAKKNCGMPFVKEKCAASCNCKTEII
ncbi:cysteine-rich venom protein kaouthin-2-like [Hyla sarda]|uniref:cysteine-rich venom protein kaouthin-2-like n=1 Tax=Hyla sarda TaxID=327740 RepID=UPI0024C402FF|nr:cysteine-rich venom protein kaouthin-2-like [Hyla sarda]